MSSIGSSSNRVPVSFNSNQQSVQGQIESKQSQLTGLQSRLSALYEALAGIQDPPQPTGSGKSYERAMEAWRQACSANDAKRSEINGQIQSTQSEIARVQGELQQLNSIAMPNAQAKDRREMEDHFDREKKAADAQMQAAQGPTNGKEVEGEDVRRVVQRAEDKTRSVVRDDIQRTRDTRAPSAKPPSGSGVPPVGMP
jgi:chromosome segregation ATPase